MTARRELLHWGEQQLYAAGITDWKPDSWLLYEAVSRITRTEFFLRSREEMPESEQNRYKDMIERRCRRVPVQHIIGEQVFMGYSFQVNEHVLIPRMDTEILVLEVEKSLSGTESVLDMCTGSGCIALSLKGRNPGLTVTGTDISGEALKVAEQNRKRLGVFVEFYQSDLFSYLEEVRHIERFDRIVSNPPYIPDSVIDGLEEEVRCHEPRIALDGRKDGLEFYKRITRDSRRWLREEGMLFYEIGYNQAEAVCAVMEEEGFGNIKVVKDLAGLDRVVYGGMQHV